MIAPRIPASEPLGQELRDFASAIREGTTPVSNAHLGLEIVLCLEALEESLQNQGKPVAVQPVAEALSAARTSLPAPLPSRD
jgi:predicted dehydrogenase